MRQLAFFGEHGMGRMAWHASSICISVPLCPLLWLCNLHPYFKIGRHQQQQQVCNIGSRLGAAVTVRDAELVSRSWALWTLGGCWAEARGWLSGGAGRLVGWLPL
ncbi:hypothetical protein N431DRAFT_72481 [Stipitochalara longipes BDJ]|nr:hypothetical protein N431DRAFT_72481 [Stipitochalara longipes BDJ]